MPTGWLLYVLATVAVAAVVLVFWLTFRSLKRWRQAPPGRSPESQQAEARLWSKLNINRR